MKSCVLFFFFFLASLISSNTASPPPGIKLQIRENAKDVLKDLGLMYLKGLVNKEFPIDYICFPIRSVKFIELQVDPAKVDFKFQDNIGLQIEIKDMTFSLEIQREAKLPVLQINTIKGTTTLTGEGVTATIPVRMNQNPQGHLNVEIPRDSCTIKADTIRTASTGLTWFLWDSLRLLYQYLFNNKICPALQPMINDKLKDLPMMRTVYEDHQLDLDYSLSSDIKVTSSSLDVSFKGLMFVHGETVNPGSIRPGKEPVFTETKNMVYVGISEFFFNGAAMAIYKSRPFEFNIPEMEALQGTGLKALGIKPGPWTAELTEAPVIQIGKDDLRATVKFKAQPKAKLDGFLMKCEFNMDVKFKERLLITNIQEPTCKDKAGTFKSKFLAFLVNVFRERITNWLVKEIPIPLPAELSIIDAKTQFEEGYLVVGGGLTFNPQSSSNAGG